VTSLPLLSENNYLYDREDHAAAHTGDYVFSQLIPYIGNKRKLLGLIQKALHKVGVGADATFLDVFAGSGVVSRMAKRMGFRVITNDWEPYSFEINKCSVQCNDAPAFRHLGGYANALDRLNALPPVEDWITKHLCPSDDDNYDVLTDRLFYTRSNGMMMDAMRLEVAQWEEADLISPLEKSCLLAPMLYQACYTSNTSGVFKGFHNGWGGQTGTALYRILSDFHLKPMVFHDNGKNNLVFKIDSADLAQTLENCQVRADVAYLDPPYNQHPYGSNYHVLNTIALWDEPVLSERIEGRNKAAIREDWRTQRRSAYNYRREATAAYVGLMHSLRARYLLTSYSTDGMVSLRDLVETCVSRGQTDFVLQGYKRYRVSSQRFSHKPVNIEFILTVDTSKDHQGPSVQEICDKIVQAEQTALVQHPEIAPGRFKQRVMFEGE